MKKFEIIYKKVGETPLEALERYRATQVTAGNAEFASVPMTYAGRLDPMAEGELLILIGEECRQKEKYLGLDKEYEVEIVYGFETDTYDALGLASAQTMQVEVLDKFCPKLPPTLQTYAGRFVQEYPPYSSRTVHGKQLHELARAGELPEEMPTKEVEIYAIELLETGTITTQQLKTRMFDMIGRVKGDFRQAEIKNRWNEILAKQQVLAQSFPVQKIRVKCSSGTYMRSLAHRMGKDAHTGAFALTIKRTKIYM